MEIDNLWINALWNTLTLGLIVVSIALPSGTFLAWCTNLCRWRGVRLLDALITSTILIPLYIQAGSWNALFGDFGWWTLTQTGASSNRLSGLTAIAWIHAMAMVPWVYFIMGHGIRRLDRSVVDLLRLEKCSLFDQIKIHSRALLPWLGLSCAFILWPVLAEMVVTNLYRYPTLAEQVYQDATVGKLDWFGHLIAAIPAGALFGVTTLLIVTLFLPSQQADHQPPTARKLSHRRLAHLLLPGICWAMAGITVFLPMLSLVIKAGWVSNLGMDGPTITWRLSQAISTVAATPRTFFSEFSWSFQIAFWGTLVWLPIATLIAWLSHVRRLPIWPIALLSGMLLATPGPTVAVCCIKLLNHSNPEWLGWLYDNTLLAPLTALGSRCFPIAFFFALATFRSVSPKVLEAAKLDGAGTWRCMILSILARRSQWLGGLLLVAMIAFSELSTILLLLPPGVNPISQRIFELLHYGVRYQESGICLILASFSVIVSLTTFSLFRK